MIRTLTALTVVAGLGVAGHMDQQDAAKADEHYCQMVRIHEQYRRAHIGEVGREAALRRPGWPAYRRDIDCNHL